MLRYFYIIFGFSILSGQYNYSLEDINPSSASFGQAIGTSYFEDHVTLHYFGYFTWGTCTNRFGQLNNLYASLKSQGYNVELIGISNGSAGSSSSGNWTSNNDSPICIDSTNQAVWNAWGASQRDLYVLDLEGNLVLQQNITTGLPDNLESLIIDLLNPTAYELCNLNDIYVSEAHTSGDPEDYIEIFNSGATSCSLEGFKLDDNQELDDLIFGDIILPAGGYWIGYEDEDSSFTSGLSSNGDEVWLADPVGNTKMISLNASLEFNGVQLSQSFTSLGEGCYTNPTPGQGNADCITLSINNSDILPNPIRLLSNYPNPFNPSTNISIEMVNSGYISLSIYNINGYQLKTIFNGFLSQGKHIFFWGGDDIDGKRVGSGVYFCMVKSANNTLSKKLILSK